MVNWAGSVENFQIWDQYRMKYKNLETEYMNSAKLQGINEAESHCFVISKVRSLKQSFENWALVERKGSGTDEQDLELGCTL